LFEFVVFIELPMIGWDAITPAIKYLKAVIPAQAGIQEGTGCPRLTTCRGRLIKPGMTC